MQNNCSRCKSSDVYAKYVKSNQIKHLGLYCKSCGSWIQWIPQTLKNLDYYQQLSKYGQEGQQVSFSFLDEKKAQNKPYIMEQNNTNGNSGQGTRTPMRTLSICLSDIPKDKIKVAGNQKAYVNLTIFDNEKTDEYGNDFSVQVGKTKEEVEAGAKTVYVGNGKIWGKKETNNSIADLPF